MDQVDVDPAVASKDAYGNVTVRQCKRDCPSCEWSGKPQCPYAARYEQ